MTVEDELLSGQHGFAVKFLYEYTRESLPRLDELLYGNQSTSYGVVFQKFVVICQTYLRDLKKQAQKSGTRPVIKAERSSVHFAEAAAPSLVVVSQVTSKKRDISNT